MTVRSIFDYHVSFTPEEVALGEAIYNYRVGPVSVDELPGVSVFYKDENSDIFHTYSAYARGVDMINGAYQFMDLTQRPRRRQPAVQHGLAASPRSI